MPPDWLGFLVSTLCVGMPAHQGRHEEFAELRFNLSEQRELVIKFAGISLISGIAADFRRFHCPDF